MARSRQFEHLQEQSLTRLKVMVPDGCPLFVRRMRPSGFDKTSGFTVTVDTDDGMTPGTSGRFQVVAAWIAGFVTAWRRRPM